MAFQVGDRVGDYEVLGVLGAGGMGQVYKVRNVISERLEAMKVLLPNLEHDPALADRFLREIKVLATLDHPNIAALRTAFRAGNQLVMVMELIEGRPLDELVRQGPVPIADALRYFSQALDALHYAHSRGVIHRDIKPANIMITPGGQVKLMDFGIAKAAGDRQLTRTGTTMGSLYYMSPEQITGAPLDARSDIYSMGVALYEVLTGTRPFRGDSEFSIMAAHLEGQVVPPIQVNPLLGPRLNELILVAIAKDPNQRFQTAEAFRKALEQTAKELVGAAGPVGATAALGVPAPPAPQPSASPPVAPQPAAPAATPPAPSVAAKSHRALYVALGAIMGIGLLVLAATQAPRWLRAKAALESAPSEPAAPTQTTTEPTPPVLEPAAEPAAVPTMPPSLPTPPRPTPSPTDSAPRPRTTLVPEAPPPAVPEAPPPAAPAAQPAPRREPPPAVQEPAARSTPAQPSAAADLQPLQERMVMLASRAVAVRNSLENLQRQQAAMGLGLRGDITASWKRMEYALDQAEAALAKGDAAAARRHMDSAERELDRLESFLGR